MKEIQYPVIHATVSHAEFVYAVAQIIRLRSSQLMTILRKTLGSDYHLVLRFLRETIEPFQQRNTFIALPEYYDFYSRHKHPFLRFGYIIALLR